MSASRAVPRAGRPTTYRGQYDMAEWWAWAEEAEAGMLPVYGLFIKPGDVCFDIGGNVGRKTYPMRRLGAKVIFVEPLLAFDMEFVPEFWWRWGGDKNVVQVPKAVTPRAAETLSVNMFMPEYSSVNRPWMTESSHSPGAGVGNSWYNPTSLIQRKVPGVTLDALIAVYGLPAFMKVDVEGAENDAISTLHAPVPALNMEFHADWVPIPAIEHLDSLGEYEWNYCLDGGGVLVMPEWACRGRMLDYIKAHLTATGNGSWGDIYGRLAA